MKEERCPNPAAFRRFWPGRPADFVCKEHADDSLKVMESIGEYLVVTMIATDESCACSQGRVQTITTS